ncbi:MAG: phosphatase PAP2 family protein [Nocardioidaceae bacterium]
MEKSGDFRFAVTLSLGFAATAFVVAWVYDLPIRDPDGVAGPTYVRLPLILLLAFLVDVVPRTLWRVRRNPLAAARQFTDVVRERWTWQQIKFAFVGLAAWYLTYVAFRNLKSAVPFVNGRLWDSTLERVDRALFFGNDPATLLHNLLGEGLAAHVLAGVYMIWIGLVPFTLVVALVWSRNSRAGAWYVTAIAVDWVLGAIAYFIVPSLGPAYSRPDLFSELPRTVNTPLVEQLMDDRHAVLTNPLTTNAVQTIAAFPSLHVGIMVSIVVMARLLDLSRPIRFASWAFLVLTVLATIYLGWHFFVDTVAGAALGYAGVAIAAWGTGNAMRRISRDSHREAESAEPTPFSR